MEIFISISFQLFFNKLNASDFSCSSLIFFALFLLWFAKGGKKKYQRKREYQIYFKFSFLGGIAIIQLHVFTLRCLSMNQLP